jgi:hypothetical protein
MGARSDGRRSAIGAGRVGIVGALVGGWLFGILTGHTTIAGAFGNDTILSGPGADNTPDYNVSEGDKRTNVP